MQKSRVGPVQPVGDNVGMFSGVVRFKMEEAAQADLTYPR